MTGRLSSLLAFTDAELRSLAAAAINQAATVPERSYTALWHEIGVLAAEELDRRAASFTATARDFTGLVDTDEIGAIVTDPTLGWSADE